MLGPRPRGDLRRVTRCALSGPVQGHGFSIEKVLVLMALWRDGARSVMAYASGGSPSSSTDHARCVDQRNVALLRSCWSGATLLLR